jgi:Sec-independent protein translocase protein TatA
MRKYISQEFKSTKNIQRNKAVGDSMEISCDNKITKAITSQYKKSSARWLHNNQALTIEAQRMIYRFNNLIIQNLSPKDQGTYVCKMEYEKKQYKTVAVFTLVTHPGIKRHVKESSKLKLKCPSLSMYHMINKGKRIWYHNGSRILLQPISVLNKSSEIFNNVSHSYAGNWTCKVPGIGVMWDIITYEVIIDPAPLWYENSYIYVKENPKYSGLIALGAVAALLVFVVILLFFIDKRKEKIAKQLEEFKKRLKAMNRKEKQFKKSLVNHADEQGVEVLPYTDRPLYATMGINEQYPIDPSLGYPEYNETHQLLIDPHNETVPLHQTDPNHNLDHPEYNETHQLLNDPLNQTDPNFNLGYPEYNETHQLLNDPLNQTDPNFNLGYPEYNETNQLLNYQLNHRA